MTAASAIADMYGPRNRRTGAALANAFREIDAAAATTPLGPWREPKPARDYGDPRIRILEIMDAMNDGVTRKAAE